MEDKPHGIPYSLERLRGAIRTKAYWDARTDLGRKKEEVMPKTKVVSLRIPENLDQLAFLSARQEHTDKATAPRRWLHQGAAHYALKLVSTGRISMSHAAELLGVSVYDLYNLAEAYAIELGATDAQRRRSRELAARLGQEGS